jgi:hypothetical protein
MGGGKGGRERNIRSERKRETFGYLYIVLLRYLFSRVNIHIATHIQECTHVENACGSMSQNG